MLDTAIDDMHRIDAGFCSVERRRNLRKHATRDGAVFEHVINLAGRQIGQQLSIFIQHTRNIGHHDQLFRAQDFCDLASDQIGIDVVCLTINAKANGRNDRNEGIVLQCFDHRWVDRLDLTDKADIDIFTRLVFVRHLHLAGPNQTTIFTGQANSLAAVMIDQHHDVLLHLATEHPLDHFHGLFVGNAHALHEAALLADFFQRAINLWAATMDHHRVHTDQLQQDDVARKAMLKSLFSHGIAAVFDDDGLAVEFTDIRQRLCEDLGLDLRSNSRSGHCGRGCQRAGKSAILLPTRGGSRRIFRGPPLSGKHAG